MAIHVECSKAEQQKRNTGAKEQCLEGVTVRHALADDAQEFDTFTLFKTLTAWIAAIAAKLIIPLYEIEELANADTEDTYFEGNSRYLTATGKKIRTFNCFLRFCSHYALKSYNGKRMRIYEFTDKQEIMGISVDGEKVKGQLVDVQVGKRVGATKEKPAYTPVTLTYVDYNELEDNATVVKPTWSPLVELPGIFDVEIEQVSATATQIEFTVDAGCAGDAVVSLADADVILETAAGVAVDHSFVAADANGVYTLTGTGFVTGHKVKLNGVVQQTEATYEALEPLTIEIT